MEFLFAVLIFILAFVGLSLGVLFGRNQPQSCGSKADGDGCGGCRKPCKNRGQFEASKSYLR